MSITIRAVGHAGRRGATRRVPHADLLLGSIDEWLTKAEADTVRGHQLGDRTADGALEVSLHPAARPVRFEADDHGRVTVRAMTIPVGPGYHTYLTRLIDRLGEEIGVSWAPPAPPAAVEAGPSNAAIEGADDHSSDPTGALFSGNRADAERGHLAWLRSSLTAVRDARAKGATRLHLATPPGVRYTFDGAVATVLGPRDDGWLERALGDPRVAADVWPWVADAMDARYHLGRVMATLWNDIRWRPPAAPGEATLIDDVLATLHFAYPLEPGLPWPWAEWREIFALGGKTDPATHQLLQRAAEAAEQREAAAASAVVEPSKSTTPAGYRRQPVTVLHAGWAFDLPGSFTDERTAEEWSGRDQGRTVSLVAAPAMIGNQPMSPRAFLAEYASGLGTEVMEHEEGPVLGKARLVSDASTGVEVGAVEGYSAVRGSGAFIRIVIADPSDWKWALDTWRTLRPA